MLRFRYLPLVRLKRLKCLKIKSKKKKVILLIAGRPFDLKLGACFHCWANNDDDDEKSGAKKKSIEMGEKCKKIGIFVFGDFSTEPEKQQHQ